MRSWIAGSMRHLRGWDTVARAPTTAPAAAGVDVDARVVPAADGGMNMRRLLAPAVGISLGAQASDVNAGVVTVSKNINTESGNPYAEYVRAAHQALGRPPSAI